MAYICYDTLKVKRKGISSMNQLKTILLVGVLSAMLVGLGSWVAPGQMYVFVGLALLMNVGTYFFSDKLVLSMHGAQPLTEAEAPDLHRTLEELSRKAGIPKPRLYLIPEMQPNAFATGRNPEHGVVAVTEGIMRMLTPRELRGVLAHELAHIKNRDILLSSIAAAMATIISFASRMVGWGMAGGRDDDREGSNAGGLVLALVAPLAAMLIQFGISRSREFLADETGAEMSGDPEALAQALLKLEQGAHRIPVHDPQPATASLFIVNPFAGAGSLLRIFSTHPSTEERVRRLMDMARSPGLGRAVVVR